MIIFPAIDLKNGQCVRLLRGDMNKATVFSDTPAMQAASFQKAGFEYLHVVDLDGACEGSAINKAAVRDILDAVNMPVQLGGGIRTIAHIEQWLECGIARVILGTVAARDPQLVIDACKRFPSQVAVGIDAHDGMVAVEGWVETSDIRAIDLAKRFDDAGVAAIIYTDIARDGAMQGPNLEETAIVAESISTPVILSGGVTTIDDIHRIKHYESRNIIGAIVGRALYEGSIDYAEATSA